MSALPMRFPNLGAAKFGIADKQDSRQNRQCVSRILAQPSSG